MYDALVQAGYQFSQHSLLSRSQWYRKTRDYKGTPRTNLMNESEQLKLKSMIEDMINAK